MNLAGSALKQKLCRLTQLCAAHDGVVDDQQALVLHELRNGNQLHLGNQVALLLHGWHEGTRPGGRILNQRSGERNSCRIRISDGVCGSRIRDAGYDIRVNGIALRKHLAAVISRMLDADALVRGRRISVVDPKESTNLHLLPGSDQRVQLLRVEHANLSGAEFANRLVSEICIREALKRRTVCSVLVTDGNRRASEAVARCEDAFLRQHKHGDGTVNHLLRITDAVDNIILLVNQCGDELGRIDLAVAHNKEMGIVF